MASRLSPVPRMMNGVATLYVNLIKLLKNVVLPNDEDLKVLCSASLMWSPVAAIVAASKIGGNTLNKGMIIWPNMKATAGGLCLGPLDPDIELVCVRPNTGTPTDTLPVAKNPNAPMGGAASARKGGAKRTNDGSKKSNKPARSGKKRGAEEVELEEGPAKGGGRFMTDQEIEDMTRAIEAKAREDAQKAQALLMGQNGGTKGTNDGSVETSDNPDESPAEEKTEMDLDESPVDAGESGAKSGSSSESGSSSDSGSSSSSDSGSDSD